MRLQFSKLQDNNKEAKALRDAGLPEDWKEVKRVLQYRGLPYIPDIIHYEIISYHHDDPFAGHFGIDKTQDLIS